ERRIPFGAASIPNPEPSAEFVIIPTGPSRLAGQAIRLVRRIRLSVDCFRLCGWGRQPVAQHVVSPTRVSARLGRDRLTRPAPAVRATGVAGWGRAVPGPRATRCPLPAFSRARHGKQAKKARPFTGAGPTPPACPARVG